MKQKKRVLLIHRHFFPDSPPYALILKNMRNSLIKEGYFVDVLSAQPSYKSDDRNKKKPFKEFIDKNSIVFRFPVFSFKNKIAKVLNFFYFPISIFFFILFKKKYDLITVSTAPQVLLAFFVSVAAKIKGSKTIYHCMDIHPEIGKLSGEFSNKFIYSILLAMDNYTCRQATKIIVLSQDMKDSLIKRKVKPIDKKIEIINNYSILEDIDIDNKKTSPFFKEKTIKRVVFAGNIGRYQNLNIFIEALKNKNKLYNFKLTFIGEGNALEELKRISIDVKENVEFIPHQSFEKIKMMLQEADFSIISLQKEVIRYAYPSKTMVYMQLGIPVLANIDNENSELFNFINNTRIGIASNFQNEKELYDIYKNINEEKLIFQSKEIQQVYNDNFSKQKFNEKIIKVINTVLEEE